VVCQYLCLVPAFLNFSVAIQSHNNYHSFPFHCESCKQETYRDIMKEISLSQTQYKFNCQPHESKTVHFHSSPRKDFNFSSQARLRWNLSKLGTSQSCTKWLTWILEGNISKCLFPYNSLNPENIWLHTTKAQLFSFICLYFFLSITIVIPDWGNKLVPGEF
jgi:hypothetical protein